MAKKCEFITFSQAQLERDVANFGHAPEELVALFKNRKGHEKECMQACRELHKREPGNCVAMLYLATLHDEAKEFKQAVKYYRKITKAVPLISPIWQRQGMAELMTLDCAAGRHSLMQYGYLQPGEWFSTCLIGLSYVMEDKKEICFYFLDEVLKAGKIDKPDKIVWFKAYLEEREGDTQQALLHYVESMMMGGDDSPQEKATTALKIRELAEKQGDE